MVSINLFTPVLRSLPPATSKDIAQVCGAALVYCVITAGVVSGLTAAFVKIPALGDTMFRGVAFVMDNILL